MIPKTIHYCWFGKNKMPKDQQAYIAGWKKLMPDYTFKCWNENEFDIDSVRFTRDARADGKYAFVADYVRVYALLTEGGIYMDTDVKVNQRFDEFLKYSFFTSFEWHPQYREYEIYKEMVDIKGNRIEKDSTVKIPGCGLMSAIIASEPNSEYMHKLMELYNSISYKELRIKNYTIPSTLAIYAEPYGFRYVNDNQYLEGNIAVFKSDVFADYRTSSRNSVAVHCVAGSWGNKTLLSMIIGKMYRIKILRDTYMKVRNIITGNDLKY